MVSAFVSLFTGAVRTTGQNLVIPAAQRQPEAEDANASGHLPLGVFSFSQRMRSTSFQDLLVSHD